MDLLCLGVYCVTFLVEPCIWLKVFSNLFRKKYNNRIFYFLSFFGIYFIITLKQFFTFFMPNNWFNTFYVPLFIAFLMIILQFLYENTIPEKLLCIGALFLFSMLTDAIALGCCLLLFNFKIEEVSGYGFENVICSIFGRILTILFYIIIFSAKKVRVFDPLITTKDVLIAVIPNFIITIIYFILVHNLYAIHNNYNIVYFVVFINGISFLFSVCYLLRIAKLRKNICYEQEAKKRMIDNQLDFYRQIQNYEKEYKKLSDDLLARCGILEVRCKEKNYEAVEHSLEDIYNMLEENRNSFPLYFLNNRMVEVLLKQEEKAAKEKNIKFTSHVAVKEFGIKDSEICYILSTMIHNAMDIIEKEDLEEKEIKLNIEYSSNGYYILCENTLKMQPIVKNDAYIICRTENGSYGLVINLIKDIVKKYNGNLKFGYRKGCFSMYTYISPLGKLS